MNETLRQRFEACLRTLDAYHYAQCSVHTPSARCSCALHIVKSALRDNWNQMESALTNATALRAEVEALRVLLVEARGMIDSDFISDREYLISLDQRIGAALAREGKE